ncbi:SIMPL domain-containing protein [Chroococcus sp. FPU101]|uniref:SIMPL domain-containing protein n=1 Tax=Chroococcus sp. FPU101 TaxID=1974212 RepID=UPI001A8E6001|nr:SIMPL domain-containing protein [Chroococcus sp. FPU101]GFE70251.1 hypothetical protein CFPU101_28610 [Chroococcus sp. FPU101]
MAKTAILPLMSGLLLLISSIPVKANPLNPIAQFFYPPANNPQTFMVVGKGKAKQKADTAVLKFTLSAVSPTDDNTVAYFIKAQKKTPLETQVKDIVDALLAIGISKTDIEIQYPQNSTSGFSLPFPLPTPTNNTNTKIFVTVANPTHPRLQQIITTAGSAIRKDQPFKFDQFEVRYSVNDCQALQRETYKNAMKDAQNRAIALADAVNAELNPIPSVAEPFYGVFLPEECATGEGFLFGSSSVPYDANDPLEVEVSKEIFVTFSVR